MNDSQIRYILYIKVLILYVVLITLGTRFVSCAKCEHLYMHAAGTPNKRMQTVIIRQWSVVNVMYRF